MQIVIDIPEKIYHDIKTGNTGSFSIRNIAIYAIAKGTPLHNGHGRLIDADRLINKCAYDLDNNFVIDLIDVKEADTIIDADTTESGKPLDRNVFNSTILKEFQKGMRDATPEERESVDKYIKGISKLIGVDFWDLEQEPCGDAISRQAVLDILNRSEWKTPEELEVFEFVKKLPSVNSMQSSDVISRQMALDTVDDLRTIITNNMPELIYKSSVLKWLHELPSVNPQETKTGYWKRRIVDSGYNADWKCSECGNKEMTDFPTEYCPNCGAKMIEPKEREEEE